MPKLSDMALKNLPVPARGQITYDDEGTPLKVRVSQGGTKTFVVMLGSGKRYTIGRYGEVTLSEAREAARRLKAEKTLGRILPSSKSLNEARAEYLGQLGIRANTRLYYERNLNRLKAGKLTDITAREIARLTDALPKTSSNQALATYRAFFKWCQRRHYIEKSPCDFMTLAPSTSRARVLSDAELKLVWQACERGDGLPANFATIVKLLILTGQRRGEISALRWEWISEDERTISFPPTITKNGRAHTIPFGQFTFDLMDEWGSGMLFQARGSDRAFNGWSKSKAALDKLSGVTGWTLHDLRRTYATKQAALGTPIHVVEKLLNHASGTVSGLAAVYNRHAYFEEMKVAVERYESFLQTLLHKPA